MRTAVLVVVCMLIAFAGGLLAAGHVTIVNPLASSEPRGVITDQQALTVRVGEPERSVRARLGEPQQTTAGPCLVYGLDTGGQWQFCLVNGQVARAQRDG